MKKLFITLFLLSVSLTYSYAEFPSPREFEMTYQYIIIGDYDFCGGVYVVGPTYCTSFSWKEPEGSLKPIEYKVYYKSSYQEPNIIEVLDATSDTYFQMEIGIMGEVWVTAVYENGESEPSNVEKNENLPSSIENIKESNDNLYYDYATGNIVLNNNDDIKYLTIINNLGDVIDRIENPKSEINIANYIDGTYIVKAESVDSKISIIKIMKNRNR